MGATMKLSRREFVKLTGAAGAGLVLGVHLPACRPPDAAGDPFAPNAWVRLDAEGVLTVMVDRSEMGQGVATSLPMLVAEELDADWERVRFAFAPADPVYANPMFGLQGTGGSTSVRAGWEPLRKAGGAARLMLVTAAATRWGVPEAECRTEASHVIHDATDRRLDYGELVEDAARLSVPAEVTLKDPSAFRLIGTARRRLDTADKSRGTAGFGIDVQVPGLLIACVARCPVFGGAVAQYDDAAARAIPGVRHVVQIGSGIAVVADHYWGALEGKRALAVTWNEGETAAQTSEKIAQQFRTLAAEPGAVARDDGDAAHALTAASRTIEATYALPFLAHATMEPMTATAHVQADRVDVWAPTQNQTGSRDLAARIAGVPLEQAAVHTTYLGGGFGRRFELDFVQDALETSKAVGAPVKVVYSREDDIQHDFYRPASYHVLRAALDGSGNPVAWSHRVVAPSIMARWFPDSIQNGLDGEAVEGAVGLPYAIPNVRVEYRMAETGIPVGFWRSVNHTHNGFVTECFIDELARAARTDPYEYRRRLLADAPRHGQVLQTAAERAGWGTPLPAGRARGIAVHESFASIVAQVAEVSLESGRVRVHRVVCAVDCGPVVNPDTLEAQVESAMVYGLTAALYGAITIDAGRVQQSNFHDYEMLRMNEMPTVEVHVVSGHDSPGGAGEIGTPPIAPAVANAVAALTRRPVRSLPIRV
jgi:isoquinoline 1-oxidoreductase beta subunit